MKFIQRVKTKPGYKMLLIAALIATGMTIDYRTEQTKPLDIVVEQKPVDPVEVKIARFMAKENSPVPAEIAKASASQKRPKLMAAVAAVESDGTPTAKGKDGEVGAWQVIPKYHGAVPTDVEGQADQAADILERLIAEENGRLRPALRRYNGGPDYKSKPSTKEYAAKVMAKVQEIK